MKKDKGSNIARMLPTDEEMNDPKVLRACIKASRTLAELRGTVECFEKGHLLPDYLSIVEAKYSCLIEGIDVDYDILLRSFVDSEYSDRNLALVLGCRRALIGDFRTFGVTDSDPEHLCSRICRKEMIPRRFRGEDVRIVTRNGTVVYVPPSGDRVSGLMDEFDKWR